MKPDHASRSWAVDKRIYQHDNAFSRAYKRSILFKILIQFILLYFASLFVANASIYTFSAEYTRQLTLNAELQVSAVGVAWFSMVFLLHLYIYCRRCFYYSLPPGLLWLGLGDLLALPYWMALFGYLTVLFTRTKSYATLLFLLILWATVNYLEIYTAAWHPGYVVIFLTLLMITVILDKTVFIKRPEKLAIAVDISANAFPVRKKGESPAASDPAAGTANVRPPADAPAQQDEPPLPKAQGPFAAYRDELFHLQQLPPLPAEMQRELEGVIRYTERILECMEEDENDVQPGSAFLERYLPQVANVVKRGLALSGQLSLHGKTDEIEQQSVRALQALHSAFAQQHMYLLENDTLAFETDLTVLNSLLRSDGFRQ